MFSKNQKLFLTLILFAVIFANFAFCLSPVSAQVSTPEPKWTGIVPCGRNEGTEAEKAPCTLCHLIVGFQRLVEYGMYMVVTLALVGIFFAGVMYMVSTGDEGMMTQAKGFLKVSLIGFSVVIGGWLIVNVTMWVLGAREDSNEGGVLGIKVEKWNKFTCDRKSTQGSGGTVNNNSNSGQLTCGTNSPGSCKAECDTSTGEVVASQYSCSTGKCCLPAPNSVTCVSKGYSCVDVSKCTAENFYAASCNNGGPISLVCCKPAGSPPSPSPSPSPGPEPAPVPAPEPTPETPPATPPTPSGQPDLALVSVTGPASSYAVGQPIKFTMTVKNQGIAPSGAFNVKIYQSSYPRSTWSVSNLDAGASVSNAITVAPDGICSIHSWCSFSVRVDPDNQVIESNEKNNSWSKTAYRGS